MPELPEVEVVRAGLTPLLVGRRIEAVRVLHPRAIRRQPPGLDFAGTLAGRTITAVNRRGKYMWFGLDDGDAVLAHLGMSGQFRFPPVGEPDHRHLRVALELTDPVSGDHSVCWFCDQRTFGGLSVSPDGALLPDELAHIARDPLDPAFDLDAVVGKMRAKQVGIKRVLLDQTVLSGVGNIYADEALWRVRLHFAREASRLRRAQVVDLIEAIAQVFAEALAAGGTSFDSLYVNVNGESGYFDRTLAVYGREGEACLRCGHAIRREAFMNRSSFRCPHCQRVPRYVRW